VCDDYLRYRSIARECTVPAAFSDLHECPARTDNRQRAEIAHLTRAQIQSAAAQKGGDRAPEHEENVGQFNLIGFVDDLSLFAQTLGGAQAILEAIQEFELWCGLKVNRKKTGAMVVELLGTGQQQMGETLVYMGQEVTFLATSAPCRYLGVWGPPQEICQTRKRGFSGEGRRHGIYSVITPSHRSRLLTSSRALELESLDIRPRWCHGRKKSFNGSKLYGSKHINGRGV
jgi:hypothetical protein